NGVQAAARWYSWISPPSRLRRSIFPLLGRPTSVAATPNLWVIPRGRTDAPARVQRQPSRNDHGGLKMNDGTTLEGKTVLITGANRGIGEALVAEALRRGASRVFAGMRPPPPAAASRVTPIKLDVTDQEQIGSAAASITSLDVLVNNAGIQLHDDLSDTAALERQLAVNLYGPLAVTNAFLP